MNDDVANKKGVFNVHFILKDRDGLVWGHAGHFDSKLFCIIFYKQPFPANTNFSTNPKSVSDNLRFTTKELMLENLSRFQDIFTITEIKTPLKIGMVLVI